MMDKQDKKSHTMLTKSETPQFFENVALIIEQARKFVGRTADLSMCVTYFVVGHMIVEEEQGGKARAEYGRGLLKELSAYLGMRFGRGYSVSTLTNARKFYQTYSTSISQTLFTKLEATDDSQKSQTMSTIFLNDGFSGFRRIISDEVNPFIVSWSHYLILMRIKNGLERKFYEIEAAKQQWSHEQLLREYNSSLYERLALSRDKDAVMQLSREGQKLEKPQDLLKNPLSLEFLGLV